MSYNLTNKKVLLIGAGYMAREYIKVLKSMGCDIIVVGNSENNAKKFQEETGITVYAGGIDNYLKNNDIDSDIYAINAVRTIFLAQVNLTLLKNGCKHLLSEKPGITTKKEGKELLKSAEKSDVYIAYNRRFYASVFAAETIIKEDGGVTSFTVEFTEWRHLLEQLEKEKKDFLNKLFLCNSSHVMDMAFYLSGGKIEKLYSIVKGQNVIDWHKNGSVFGGVGTTDLGQIFTYSANRDAPGRWGIELNTKKHRLIFRPLEKLQIQDKGSVKIYEADVDYTIDEKYKPGLYKEVESFLTDNKDSRLCTLRQQVNNITNYAKISGESLLK